MVNVRIPGHDRRPGSSIFWRVVLAGAVGVVVTGLALESARGAAGASAVLRARQWQTRSQLQLAEGDVRAYRERFGSLPRALEQLERLPEPRVRFDRSGRILDGWERPLGYIVRGNDYLLFSLGRDGQPGGTSLDADLTHRSLRPREARVSYRELFSLRETRGMVAACFLAGLCAAALAGWLADPEDFTWRGLLPLAGKILVTTGAALFAAIVLTVLHVPTGH